MNRPHRAVRTDANQAEIIADLERLGAYETLQAQQQALFYVRESLLQFGLFAVTHDLHEDERFEEAMSLLDGCGAVIDAALVSPSNKAEGNHPKGELITLHDGKNISTDECGISRKGGKTNDARRSADHLRLPLAKRQHEVRQRPHTTDRILPRLPV